MNPRETKRCATQLAPASFEARLAQVNYWVRGTWPPAITSGEAERLLRALLEERPDEPRALFLLGMLRFFQDSNSNDKGALERLAKMADFAVQATKEIAWQHFWAGRYTQANSAADRSIGLLPYWDNLGLKVMLALMWFGDLDLAKATLERMPQTALQEDAGATFAIELHWWRRDPQAMLATLDVVPRDWIRANDYIGPKAFLAGQARLLAKQTEAARVEFRRALDLLTQRLADDPGNARLLGLKARTLHHLGERAEAEKTYRLAREIKLPEPEVMVLFESADVLIAELESRFDRRHNYLDLESWDWNMTAANLRLHPVYDSLRRNPRFAALLARAESDPRKSPNAKPATTTVLPSADRKSIAVLAFVNRSDDKQAEYFSDGISEELLTLLGKVPGIRVAGWTSALTFKGTNASARDIGEKLSVAHLVDGSVRTAGARVKITVRLTRTDNGEQVWSESFEDEWKDIFALQDKIAREIAQKLQLKLAASARVTKVVNPEAHRLVLEGRHFWQLRTDAGFARAEDAFKQALALDPQWAAVHAALADLWAARAFFANDSRALQLEHCAQAKIAARRALELDSGLASPHAALGAAARLEHASSDAELHFNTALALAPNDAAIHDWYGDFLVGRGRLDAALREYQMAEQLDPLSIVVLHDLAMTFHNTRQFGEMLAVTERALALTPNARACWSRRLRRWQDWAATKRPCWRCAPRRLGCNAVRTYTSCTVPCSASGRWDNPPRERSSRTRSFDGWVRPACCARPFFLPPARRRCIRHAAAEQRSQRRGCVLASGVRRVSGRSALRSNARCLGDERGIQSSPRHPGADADARRSRADQRPGTTDQGPVSTMRDGNKAVFLSSAHEDSDVARRTRASRGVSSLEFRVWS